MTTMWEQVTANVKLASLPQVYLQLQQVMKRPGYAMSDVALVISNDPAITARLLRLVNSPFFGLAAEIETVSRAISMLGTDQVHDLVLATTLMERFEGMSNQVMDMATFWHHSVYCGVLARLLAYQCNVLDSERLFVAGLLRDIGHLLMYQTIPEPSEQAIRRAEATGQPQFRVEREIMGLDYARVGGELMRQWNLPRSLQESTEFHIEPANAGEFPLETSIVHIAAVLTEAAEGGIEQTLWQPRIDAVAWQVTDLSPEQCNASLESAAGQVDEVLSLFLPKPRRARI